MSGTLDRAACFGRIVCIWFLAGSSIFLSETCIRSVYKELHADHETRAADNK